MLVRLDWRGSLSGAPRPLGDWLTEAGSLTARCQRHCREFRVRVLAQGRGPALADETARGRPPVREVLLECDGVPVIFAESVLSGRRCGRLGRWFARLGSRSLGSLLFIHRGFRRGDIEFVRLRPRDALHRRVCAVLGQPLPALWARRSRHSLDGGSVLVTEVFLPAIRGLA
jgi:chorismate--pyruvate lyase